MSEQQGAQETKSASRSEKAPAKPSSEDQQAAAEALKTAAEAKAKMAPLVMHSVSFQVDDSTVSQRHAMVRPADEGVMIYDLGSANGTTVDGEALTGSLLKSGDVIKLGDAELEFSLNA